MHEGGICAELINIVSKAAKANGIERVYEIVMVVGPYSGIHEGQLNFYFDIARKGTCMEEAVIVMERDMNLTGASQMYIRTFRGE